MANEWGFTFYNETTTLTEYAPLPSGRREVWVYERGTIAPVTNLRRRLMRLLPFMWWRWLVFPCDYSFWWHGWRRFKFLFTRVGWTR